MAQLEGFEPAQDLRPLSVFKTDPFIQTWVKLRISPVSPQEFDYIHPEYGCAAPRSKEFHLTPTPYGLVVHLLTFMSELGTMLTKPMFSFHR